MALCLGVLATQARPDELTDAQHFLDAGAAQLVLQQMDAAGVPESPTTRNEWLRVQWQALAMAGTPQEIIDQAARLPKDIPDTLHHDADLLAARAAIQLGQGGLARKYLSVLLWQLPVQAVELPDLRALVVQSHLLPVPDADAASLMLRDQQDFGIDPVLRKAYILAVLQAGQKTDLSSLRSGLADSDPLAVLIDAHAGRLSDDELQSRIGALLQGNALDEPLLLALRQTVAGMNAESLQVQIDERLLNLPEPPSGINALLVWKAYHSMTQSFGNVRLLLFGSDAGWAEQAQAVAAQDPVMARAIWAYLAREAKDGALRATAQQQFLDQMAALQLGRAALRMFEAAWPDLPAQGFASPVRYRLGQLALAAGEDGHAAQLWQDPALLPADGDARAWQAARAQLFARVQDWPAAGQALSAWLDQPHAMAGKETWDMTLLAAQLSRHADQTQAARKLLERMYPAAGRDQQRLIAARLGQLAADGQPADAAQWYLRAADGAAVTDALAWQSLRRAADCLARAGLRDDARRLDQRIAAQCPDAALQAEARHALDHL